MRHLLERGVYFTLTATKSRKVNKINTRRLVCSRSKIENRVCDFEINPFCANAKPGDVVLTVMFSSSSSSIGVNHVGIDGLFDISLLHALFDIRVK